METFWFNSIVDQATQSIINETPNHPEAKSLIRKIVKAVALQSLLRGVREPMDAKIDIVEALEPDNLLLKG